MNEYSQYADFIEACRRPAKYRDSFIRNSKAAPVKARTKTERKPRKSERIYGPKRKPGPKHKPVVPKPPKPPRELKPCGTTAAHKRHIRHGEEPCRDCKDAYNAARPYQPHPERRKT